LRALALEVAKSTSVRICCIGHDCLNSKKDTFQAMQIGSDLRLKFLGIPVKALLVVSPKQIDD
jgi:hypothetical protein